MFRHDSELVLMFCFVFFIHLCYSFVYRAAVGTHDAFSLNISTRGVTQFVSISLSNAGETSRPVMNQGPICISEYRKDQISVLI